MPAVERPGMIARLGLAVASPQWALAVADQPAHAGRSGSDLIRLFGLLLVSAHARRLVAAGWLAVAGGASAGASGVVAALSQALTTDLAFLVIATLGVWLAAGRRRALGRAFDLVCVAVVPLIAVELVATAAVRAAELAPPRAVVIGLAGAAFAWAGALVMLAWRQIRRTQPTVVEVPARVVTRGRRAGIGLVVVAALGLAVNVTWIARNADLLRPMTPGDLAPAFTLPAIEPGGALGPATSLESWRAKVVVVDFWATWCGPCVEALPRLAALHAELGADGAVVLINLDDAAVARALVDRDAPGVPLLYDDADVARRYGVEPLPHTVVIDRGGRVRAVIRGGGGNLRAEVARARGTP